LSRGKGEKSATEEGMAESVHQDTDGRKESEKILSQRG